MQTKPKNQAFAAGIIGYVLAVVTGFFLLENRRVIPIFELRFNMYALISIAGFIALTVALGFMIKHYRKSDENTWLIVALAAMIIYTLAECFQRLSVYPETAVFWAQLGGLGAYFVAAGVFLFILHYTRPAFLNSFLVATVLLSAAMLTFFSSIGSLVFRVDSEYVHLYPWGYNNVVGPGFLLHLAWILGLYITGLVILFQFRRKTGNSGLRRQSTIFFFAMLAPVVGGMVFDSILPALHISLFPPLAALFATLTGILLTVGALRYRIFELSPSIVSQNILSTMKEAVIATDAHFDIEFINKEASKLLEAKENTIVRKPISNFFSGSTEIEATLKQMHQSKGGVVVLPPIDDVVIHSQDGTKFTRILTSPIVEGNRTEGYIFVISDVTELKQAYRSLEKAKNSVERTVEIRTRELRQAQQKLLDMDKLKTEFIMLTSHNLRTPLSIISGYVSVLKSTPLSAKQKHIMDNLELSSERLGKLINDLLTISAIESNEQELSRRPMKASELLWEVAHNLDDTAKGNGNDDKFIRNIEVGDAYISASPERLKAALGNILENSFKFTKNGEVKLDAKVDGNNIIVTVRDTGIGIKADELPKMFTKFHRGTDTLQFGYEGGGIGLYLTKLVIDEHEGTIKVESKEGKGTTMTVTLPVAPAPSHE